MIEIRNTLQEKSAVIEHEQNLSKKSQRSSYTS